MTIYAEIEKLLSECTGLDPDSIGRATIKNEIDSLMKAAGVEDPFLFLKGLEEDEENLKRLIERIVVPETWFFRDRESFNFLKAYAGETLCRSNQDPIRVLSAPCSTGEEAYSIAITLLEAGLPPGGFEVDAFDISEPALTTARRGRYGGTSFRGVQMPDESRFFSPLENGFEVNPVAAGRVNFVCDNILRPDFPSGKGSYRIIFCRNLLIYLNSESRRRLFSHLDRLLAPDGILFAGHSELPSFLQAGYGAVNHPRSFACMKSGAKSRISALDVLSTAPREREPSRTTELSGMAEPVPAQWTAPSAPRASRDRAEREPRRRESPLAAIRKLADRGALKEASLLCEGYLKENGANQDGLCLMGIICQAMNHPDRAEGFFLKALYLSPAHYEALVHMSLLCDQKGDHERAALFRDRIRRIEGSGNQEGEGR